MKTQTSGAVSISSSHSSIAGRSLRRSHNGAGIYHLQQPATSQIGGDPPIVNGKARNSGNTNSSSAAALGSKFQPVKPVQGGDPCVLNTKKIFVGGISVATTRSKLMEYFAQYGHVSDCTIMVDRDHKPRGFGFVTFDNPQTLDRILEISDHYVDGKLVECKKAVPKENPCAGLLQPTMIAKQPLFAKKQPDSSGSSSKLTALSTAQCVAPIESSRQGPTPLPIKQQQSNSDLTTRVVNKNSIVHQVVNQDVANFTEIFRSQIEQNSAQQSAQAAAAAIQDTAKAKSLTVAKAKDEQCLVVLSPKELDQVKLVDDKLQAPIIQPHQKPALPLKTTQTVKTNAAKSPSTLVIEELKIDKAKQQPLLPANSIGEQVSIASPLKTSSRLHADEKSQKFKWDQLDEKVAQFADKLLTDHQDNKVVEDEGKSRRETNKSLGNWAEALKYQTEPDATKNTTQDFKVADAANTYDQRIATSTQSSPTNQSERTMKFTDQQEQMFCDKMLQQSRVDQAQMEILATKFVDSIDHGLPTREALSKEQLLIDEEELDTLKILGNNSLTSGDQIDAQLRKVFVGGLPHNLQLACFRLYFENFGDIEDCVILQDKRTNKPRGFGFVTYKDIRSVNLVLKLKQKHVIQNKWVDVKSAVPIQQMKEVMFAQQSRQQLRDKSRGNVPFQQYPWMYLDHHHHHQMMSMPVWSLHPLHQADMAAMGGHMPQQQYNHGAESHLNNANYDMYHPQHNHMMHQHHHQMHHGPPPYNSGPGGYYDGYAAHGQIPHPAYRPRPQYVGQQNPGLFPDHKPPLPGSDLLSQQQYHQYMQAAATQWHRNQSQQLNNTQELSGEGADSRSAESQSSNNKTAQLDEKAEIDSTTDQSLDSSKSDETKQLLAASSRPSRLPPPIPPPPGFIEQGLLKDSQQAQAMSPDFNLHSANAHQVQIEKHVQSLMSCYQDTGKQPVTKSNGARKGNVSSVKSQGASRQNFAFKELTLSTKVDSKELAGRQHQESKKKEKIDKFHKEIEDDNENTQSRQSQDNFDPNGEVYWGSDPMGGIFSSQQQE